MSETIDSGTQPVDDAAIATDLNETPSETVEAQTTETSDESANPKPDEPKRRPWFEKVIADKSFEAREYKRQVEALQAQLQSQQRSAQPTQTPQAPAALPDMIPVAEVERLVEARAPAQSFNSACDHIADTGAAKFADFGDAVKNFSLLGGPSVPLLEAIVDLGPDAGAKVFYDLGKNPDEAARILALPPVKMAMALSKMASAAPKAIPVSKVPEPIKPVTGGNTRTDGEPDPKNMAEWSKWFRAQSRR